MNHLRELFFERRSTRQFTDEGIPEEMVHTLLEAALLAPTGRTKRSCRFLVVKEKDMLHKISMAKAHGAALIADAACAIVVLGDESTTDIWVEDASIATTFIQLMAEELGIGSCWVQIRNRYRDEKRTESSEEYLKNLLKIPGHLRVLSVVALGHKKEENKRRKEDTLDWSQTADWSTFKEGNHEL